MNTTLIIIVDINGKGIVNFPFKILARVIDLTIVNFRGTLDKLFILNPSFSLNASWSIIKGMLDNDTNNKISFFNKANFSKM